MHSVPYQVFSLQEAIVNPNVAGAFLRGAGGTGKTYAIAKLIAHAHISSSEYIFMGPTGKSVSVAEEKGIVGSTIHRFFHIQNNNTASDIDKFIRFKFGSMDKYYLEMSKVMSPIKYFFIDEISMVNNEVLMFMLSTIIHVKGSNLHKIFLGGDFHQLPPVINTARPQNEGLTSSLALVSGLISSGELKTVDFVTRYRSDNEDYNEFLYDLRSGKIRDKVVVATKLRNFFNVYSTPELPLDIRKELTFLEFTNDSVKNVNDRLLSLLEGPVFTNSSEFVTDTCIARDDTRINIINDFQMDDSVTIKIGSKILFRVNHIDDHFKNGDEGIIEGIDTETGEVLVRKLRNDAVIKVSKHTYKSGDLDQREGYNIIMEQYPFSLGNARTYHKAQGDGFRYIHMNFDFLRMNMLDNETKWQLLYVGLSRVMDPQHVYVHEKSIGALLSVGNLFQNIKYDKLGLVGIENSLSDRYTRR